MKKFFVAILAVLYLTSSSGATVHLHYCMGKLVKLGLSGSAIKKCPKCGMTQSHESAENGCCKDEQKQIKIEQDQKVTNISFNFIHSTPAVLTYFSEQSEIKIISNSKSNPDSNAPLRSQASLHILHCIFLI